MAGKRQRPEGIGEYGSGARGYVDSVYNEILRQAGPHKAALKFVGKLAVGLEDTPSYAAEAEAARRQDAPPQDAELYEYHYHPVDPETREGKVAPGEEYAHYPERRTVELVMYSGSDADIGPNVTNLDYVYRYPAK